MALTFPNRSRSYDAAGQRRRPLKVCRGLMTGMMT